MAILLLLLYLLVIVIALFSIKLIKIVKQDNINKTIDFLRKFLLVIGVAMLLVYISLFIVAIINISESEYVYVMFVKLIIHTIYYISIFTLAKKLLDNLNNDIIFEEENVESIKKIGSNFIYLGVVEIITGLVLGIFNILSDSSWKEFRLETNPTVILFLIIGNILLIISYILKKAIEIYKENQLTI